MVSQDVVAPKATPQLQAAWESWCQEPSLGAFTALAQAYNAQPEANAQLKQEIFSQLYAQHYAPHAAQLKETYERNVQALLDYPYFWDKDFTAFADLDFLLFPLPDGTFYLYDREQDRFVGQYDGTTAQQMRYFFQDLSQALQVADEDNLYNLTFLFDNVRRSEDIAKDNHIYLMYNSWQPLQRVMQVGALQPILEHTKFVFLVGEHNHARYPIDFAQDYGINYRKMRIQPLRIEEINRIVFNQYYPYSGTCFLGGIFHNSSYVLSFSAWTFFEASPEIVDTFVKWIKTPEATVHVPTFLNELKQHIGGFVGTGHVEIVQVLPGVLGDRQTITVHELFKAVMIAATMVSQVLEGKMYLNRISPIIYFDPHQANFDLYYELLKHFKYTTVFSPVREPIMTFFRAFASMGPRDEPLVKSILNSTYEHSLHIPKWLTNQGFKVVRFEDLKLNSVKALHALCRALNFPYQKQLTVDDIGIWCVMTNNEYKDRVFGFEQNALKRDISHMLTDFDRERLNLFYWPIHKLFGYPCAAEQKRLTAAEAEQLFAQPFLIEKLAKESYDKTYKKQDAQPNGTPDKQCTMLPPEQVQQIIHESLLKHYLKGFDPDMALPQVIFPEEEGYQEPSQAQRLAELAEQAGLAGMAATATGAEGKA